MKYIAFLGPDEWWDGMDWVYALFEDKSEHEFYVFEAKKPDIVRDKMADLLYKKALRGGIEDIYETAFDGLLGMEFEDDELLEYFGEDDGRAVIGFYEKYTYESFADCDISLHGFPGKKQFEKKDIDRFCDFKKENLEKLYKTSIKGYILVAPIKKEFKE